MEYLRERLGEHVYMMICRMVHEEKMKDTCNLIEWIDFFGYEDCFPDDFCKDYSYYSFLEKVMGLRKNKVLPRKKVITKRSVTIKSMDPCLIF